MAKAPQEGLSKTRLCPPLDYAGAAALSAAFLRDTTESMVAAARLAPIVPYAAYAPLGAEDVLRPHLAPGTRLLLADGSPAMPAGVDGFGRCLLHALQGMLAEGHDAACVLSSDGPTLPTERLVEAASLLLAPGSLGLPLVELDPWYDVDDAASLATLLGERSGNPAPETNAVIARLGLRRLFALEGAA
jgi:glycosyltransferase A (GT-A) superfamily protein (DUF2064 family)